MSTQAYAQAIEGHQSMRLRNKVNFLKFTEPWLFKQWRVRAECGRGCKNTKGTPEFANDYTAGIILVGETIQLRLIMREQSSMKCAHKKARGNVLGAICDSHGN